MQFTIQHPSSSNRSAFYGWDRAVGWFVTFESDGKVEAEYDERLNPEMQEMAEVFEKFLLHGFFKREDIGKALEQMQYMDHEEMEPTLAEIADVIVNLKEAGN